jgi:N-acetylglucosamine-6-sulfatase
VKPSRTILLVLLLAVAAIHVGFAPASGRARPNIVIIMTDDQRWDSVGPRYMPNLNRYLVANGIRFRNAFVSNPLCCPSRVTTLTGKYSYSTGVYSNQGTWGGYGASVAYGAMRHTIATDLQTHGYRTGLIGKYLNGYTPRQDYLTKPPGWDRWFEVKTGMYYRYFAAVDGVRKRYFGTHPSDYSTRVLQARAINFIDLSQATDRPFFLYFAPTAPHGPATPDPRDVGRFEAVVASYAHPPSVGEPNVSDKPPYIRAKAWTSRIRSRDDALHGKQLDAAYGVDRAIGAIWNDLPTNTVVLFMSDNGFLWGEHRWQGKNVPYNEALRIPMVVAGKGVDLSAIGTTGGTSDKIALNVDIRATLESLAGLNPQTEGKPWTGAQVRQDFPIMNVSNGVPTYCGVRSTGFMYARYVGGFDEAYDESADPYEQDNLFVTDPSNPELPVLQAQAAAFCAEQPGRIYPDDWPTFWILRKGPHRRPGGR